MEPPDRTIERLIEAFSVPPCSKCDDSGYQEFHSGGLGGGKCTVTLRICDCACGDDVRREGGPDNG